LDYSFACPGSSTWVDKVPSRDTPSLNLADRRGGVAPNNPQVTLRQAASPGDIDAAACNDSPGIQEQPRGIGRGDVDDAASKGILRACEQSHRLQAGAGKHEGLDLRCTRQVEEAAYIGGDPDSVRAGTAIDQDSGCEVGLRGEGEDVVSAPARQAVRTAIADDAVVAGPAANCVRGACTPVADKPFGSLFI
jgi:hypothetical protein